jgi:hypothetical protein
MEPEWGVSSVNEEERRRPCTQEEHQFQVGLHDHTVARAERVTSTAGSAGCVGWTPAAARCLDQSPTR